MSKNKKPLKQDDKKEEKKPDGKENKELEFLETEKQISGLFKKQLELLSTLVQEQSKILTLSDKIHNFVLNDDKIVKLDIGGQIFSTRAQILKNEKETFFTGMFSEHINTQPNEDGTHFIDRDPTYFRFILNYLRDPSKDFCEGIDRHLDAYQLEELRGEIEFYGVQSLLTKFNNRAPIFTPLLIDSKEAQQIDTWVGKKGTWTLLYQGTKDGFASADFHRFCDNKGVTITIIKSTNGSIFGGYNAGVWQSSAAYSAWNNGLGFLFSANRAGVGKQMVKLDNKGPSCGNSNGAVRF
jgi:hypothetical protein